MYSVCKEGVQVYVSVLNISMYRVAYARGGKRERGRHSLASIYFVFGFLAVTK